MAKITYDEYFNEIKKSFMKGLNPSKAFDDYFKEKDTVDYIKDGYKHYIKHEESVGESSPSAMANCLYMMY